jgi:hypothetical protein
MWMGATGGWVSVSREGCGGYGSNDTELCAAMRTDDRVDEVDGGRRYGCGDEGRVDFLSVLEQNLRACMCVGEGGLSDESRTCTTQLACIICARTCATSRRHHITHLLAAFSTKLCLATSDRMVRPNVCVPVGRHERRMLLITRDNLLPPHPCLCRGCVSTSTPTRTRLQ